MKDLQNTQLLQDISALLDDARKNVVVAVNHTMVLTYFEIGRMIVEEEQNGENRAQYGKAVLKDLSLHLTAKFGKGFSDTNLRQMRNFYVLYSEQIQQTLSAESQNIISSTLLTNSEVDSPSNEKSQTLSANFKLSWSHYLKLMRINDIRERKFYEIESFKNNWSLRELQRQYNSALYTRLSLSKNKEEIINILQNNKQVA